MDEFKIKQLPEDFYVTEVLSTEPHSTVPTVYYYLLEKVGYRTLEVISLLETILDIVLPNKIGYAGLKDEDGVTLQYISVPRLLTQEEVTQVCCKLSEKDGSRISLSFFQAARDHLEVGKLHGNCFNIKVRNLSQDTVKRILSKKEHTVFCINYYGPQRFGLPGQIKNTHLIGEALTNGDYGLALSELCLQSSPEAEAAKNYTSSPEDYFALLDCRLNSFYQSSCFSSQWNKAISASIIKNGLKSKQCWMEEVSYLLLSNMQESGFLLSCNKTLKNKRASIKNGSIQYSEYTRPPIISSKIMVRESGSDELNPNKFFCTLSFFLPSGSYASMIIPQFLTFIDESILSDRLEKVSC